LTLSDLYVSIYKYYATVREEAVWKMTGKIGNSMIHATTAHIGQEG